MHYLKLMLIGIVLAAVGACAPAPAAPTAAPTAVATAAAPASTTAAPAGTAQATAAATVAAAATAAATASAAPSAAPTAAPATAVPAAAARIAVQLADNSLQLVDPKGGPSLTVKASDPADLSSITGLGSVQGDKLYLALSGQTSHVVRVSANGAQSQSLDWIKGPINGLAASANAIAWGKLDQSGAKPLIQIMLSAPDGSGVRAVLTDTVNAGPIVLKPQRWSQDGKRLFFARDPIGLGGYILFAGFTDLWSLDPVSGKATQLLAPRVKNGFVCMDDISPNEQYVTDHCSMTHMEVVEIAANKSAVITPPANVSGVGLVGGARFSPDSTKIAYGLARHVPGNEQGWVALSDGLSGKSTLIATSPAKDYFSVAAWLDASTLILQSNGPTAGIWLARTDGSSTKRLSDGIFLGVLNNQSGGQSSNQSSGSSSAVACGAVRMLGPNPPSDKAALQAEDCFFQAFQACQAATLAVTMMGVDAGTTNNFAIEAQGTGCRVTGNVVRYVVPRPTAVPEQFVCQGLSRKNNGLVFSGCGAQGDIVVPAP